MKRLMSLWLIGMIGILPAIGTTIFSDNLVFGNIRTEGLLQAGQVQRVYVEVTNTGSEPYYGLWIIRGNEEEEGSGNCYQNISVDRGEKKEVSIDFCCKRAGDYQLVVCDALDAFLFSFPLSIEESKIPNIKVDFKINSLEESNSGYYLFSDFKNIRINGTVTFTNEEETTIIDCQKLIYDSREFMQLSITPQIGENPFIKSLLAYSDDIHEVKSGESISRDFSISFQGQPEAGQKYAIQFLLLNQNVANSVSFTFKRITNVYWTADGTQKPLTINNNTLMIPRDALAVDMRGIYDFDMVFSIDVSEANPNCLYYLGFLDYVPKGFPTETNIIRDGDASTIAIDSRYDYFCPIEFKAKSAFFTYTPVSESRGPASPEMSQIMSGLIIFPFRPQLAWLQGSNAENIDNPFCNDDLKMATLLLNWEDGQSESLKFLPVSHSQEIMAFYPYLIYYIKPSPVFFYAEDIVIPGSSYPSYWVMCGPYTLTGNSTGVTVENAYLWNCDNHAFKPCLEPTSVSPFTVRVTPRNPNTGLQEELPYSILDEPTTINGILSDPADLNTQLPVYSLSGQKVGMATNINGQIRTEGLKPGLYVVGGRKISVK